MLVRGVLYVWGVGYSVHDDSGRGAAPISHAFGRHPRPLLATQSHACRSRAGRMRAGHSYCMRMSRS